MRGDVGRDAGEPGEWPVLAWASQKWLDAQVASLLRGDHVAPADAKVTVGQWCDTWLAGYGNRRESSVRMAEVHLKIIKAHFGAVPLSAV